MTDRQTTNQGLDASLRGFLKTNADIVTRITKPVRMEDIGALSAQSDQPILFENIVEKPSTRLSGGIRSMISSKVRPWHW